MLETLVEVCKINFHSKYDTNELNNLKLSSSIATQNQIRNKEKLKLSTVSELYKVFEM